MLAVLGCAGACADDYSSLGSVLYTGSFNPQSTNSAGNQFENFSVTAPNWFDGPGVISAAHFYLSGVCIPFRRTTSTAECRRADTSRKGYASPALEYANTTILITGNSG